MQKHKGLLAPSDFATIRLIVREEVKAEVNDQLDEKIGKLPTKDEFYSKMDKWMKRVTDKQSEKIAHSAQHDRLTKKVEKIEGYLGFASI